LKGGEGGKVPVGWKEKVTRRVTLVEDFGDNVLLDKNRVLWGERLLHSFAK